MIELSEEKGKLFYNNICNQEYQNEKDLPSLIKFFKMNQKNNNQKIKKIH